MRTASRLSIFSLAITGMCVLAACNAHRQSSRPTTAPADTVVAKLTDSSAVAEDADTSGFVTLYIAVADTGRDYYELRRLMANVHNRLRWPIDTMDRYYDTKKKEIVVSDTDADEMYRGAYFPRRLPSENMSLEYFNTYSEHTLPDNIALVAGIYEHKASADSLLAILRRYAPKSFVAAGRVFEGCMH